MFIHPSGAGELPPPPSGMEAVSDAQLFLELVVNQMNTGRVVAVESPTAHREAETAKAHRG